MHDWLNSSEFFQQSFTIDPPSSCAMSPSPKHFWGAHQIRRSVPVMAAPVMVLELMLRQAAAAIDKAGGYRACAYSPLAQPSLVGSTCTVGEPAPPRDP